MLATTAVRPSASRILTAWQTRRSFAHPSSVNGERRSQRACACLNPHEFSVRSRWPSGRISGRSRIAFACPENAERKRPGFSDVTRRPTSAVDGSGPSIGRAATSPYAVMPAHPDRDGSDQGGTSCRQRMSGRSALASRIICSRYASRPGGFVFPWKTFHVRTRTGTAGGYSTLRYARPGHDVVAEAAGKAARDALRADPALSASGPRARARAAVRVLRRALAAPRSRGGNRRGRLLARRHRDA